MEQWFSHSGDLGDIVYGLPAIRAKGGGVLYLFNTPRKTTHGMDRARMELIRPLLILQPYIKDVRYWEESERRDSDINGWRHHMRAGITIADAHLSTVGKPYTERNTKWLEVDKVVTEHLVVFCRSFRYRNNSFPWKAVWEKYKDKAVFLGIDNEYENFCTEVGSVPRVPTANLLDVARIVAGCKLFVGNQSCPLAIAHGLKAPTLCEVFPPAANCCFPRINAAYGWDGSVELPEVW